MLLDCYGSLSQLIEVFVYLWLLEPLLGALFRIMLEQRFLPDLLKIPIFRKVSRLGVYRTRSRFRACPAYKNV